MYRGIALNVIPHAEWVCKSLFQFFIFIAIAQTAIAPITDLSASAQLWVIETDLYVKKAMDICCH